MSVLLLCSDNALLMNVQRHFSCLFFFPPQNQISGNLGLPGLLVLVGKTSTHSTYISLAKVQEAEDVLSQALWEIPL